MKEPLDSNLRTTEKAEEDERIKEGIQRALNQTYGDLEFLGFYGEPKSAYLKRHVDEPASKKHFEEIKARLQELEEEGKIDLAA
jgi:hypothetical protein